MLLAVGRVQRGRLARWLRAQSPEAAQNGSAARNGEMRRAVAAWE